MAKSRADQHKRAVSVREAAYCIRPAAYLPVDPLDTVIAPNPKPMLVRKIRIGQSLFNSACEGVRCRSQFGVSHFLCNFLRFFEAGFLIFLSKDCFQPTAYFTSAIPGNVAKDIPHEMDHAALILCIRKSLTD